MNGLGRVTALCCDPATVNDGLTDVVVGDRVKFSEERQAYTVRAISADRRWMICTKPFNLQHTVLYCVLDRVEQRRGPDDFVFGFGYETDEDIAAAMERFVAGDAEISVRHDVRLYVAKVNGGPEREVLHPRESVDCLRPAADGGPCWRHREGLIAV